jgi:hypothetical protein
LVTVVWRFFISSCWPKENRKCTHHLSSITKDINTKTLKENTTVNTNRGGTTTSLKKHIEDLDLTPCSGFNCSTVLFLDTGVEVDEIPLVNDFDGHIDVVIVFWAGFVDNLVTVVWRFTITTSICPSKSFTSGISSTSTPVSRKSTVEQLKPKQKWFSYLLLQFLLAEILIEQSGFPVLSLFL